jgi:DNA-binding NarL/FixJ family response regulator
MISAVSTQIRTYVIVPQPLLARAICVALDEAADLHVVGSARGFDARAFCAAAPDIAIVDCDADITRLAETISQCRRNVPGVRICIISARLSADAMTQALSAGANGYVVKDVTPEALVSAVRALTSDGFYADPRLSTVLLRRNVQKSIVELSPRELDVVRLIAQGLSNKEIGVRLHLSDKTVKNHVANIFAKLNVKARTQIAIYALRNGLV